MTKESMWQGIAIAAMLLTVAAFAETTAGTAMNALPETAVNRVTPATVTLEIRHVTGMLHLPDGGVEMVQVHYVPEPVSLKGPEGGANIPYDYEDGTLTVTDAAVARSNALAIKWPESRWQNTMDTFEAQDAESEAMDGGLLFTGSSTARMWPTAESFPDMVTVNRGFGGSQFWDVVQFADSIVGKHQPDTIVLYSGDNDIHYGKSPEWVLADCILAVQRLRAVAQDAAVVVLGIKGSASRWGDYPAVQQANALMAIYAANTDGVSFLDLGDLLLDEGGAPNAACYLDDALHLSDEGYRRWTEALRDFLDNQ